MQYLPIRLIYLNYRLSPLSTEPLNYTSYIFFDGLAEGGRWNGGTSTPSAYEQRPIHPPFLVMTISHVPDTIHVKSGTNLEAAFYRANTVLRSPETNVTMALRLRRSRNEMDPGIQKTLTIRKIGFLLVDVPVCSEGAIWREK